MAVFQENDNYFVETCLFQDFQGSPLYIAYDVAKESRRQEISTELIKDMIVLTYGRFPGKDVLIWARQEHCVQASDRKCGEVL